MASACEDGVIRIVSVVTVPRIELPEMPDMPRNMTMWRSSILGVEAEALRGQLADFFGAKAGVLVRGVVKDSAAE